MDLPKKQYKKAKVIPSYGILPYTIIDGKTPLYLLYQHRDTFEYSEFLRGLWSSREDLKRKFHYINDEERHRIQNYTIQELWDDYWVSKSYRVYKEAFSRTKNKYESAKPFIPHILDETTPITNKKMWGFPKGKKNGHEEESMVCALREFEEETRIPAACVTPVIEEEASHVFSEAYRGTDGKDYSTDYFLGYLVEPYKVPYLELPDSIRKRTVSEEASEIGWFTLEDACELLDEHKARVLKEAHQVILGML